MSTSVSAGGKETPTKRRESDEGRMMTCGGKALLLSILLLGAFSLAGCNSGGGSDGTAPPPPAGTIVSKTAVLSGGEEVPPVTTSASGSGLLEVNTATGAVSGRVTIGTAPTSTIILAHVQEGARGVNGSIVTFLENSGSGVWSVP